MRKEPGIYLVELFDEYGSKVDTNTANSLKDSMAIGDAWKVDHPGYSFVALRVIYNSKSESLKYLKQG